MTYPLDRTALRACAARAAEIFPRVARHIARPGQLTAYLAIVELELPAGGVRRWLDWSRADVDAACLDVEDLREDPALDEAIAAAGAALRAGFNGSVQAAKRSAPAVADLNAQRAARAARRALQLLLQAGGEVVGHQAFGSVQTARTAICAARKTVGPGAIRTVRGRGFRITEAGIRAAQAMRLGQFGEYRDSPDPGGLPIQMSQKAAA